MDEEKTIYYNGNTNKTSVMLYWVGVNHKIYSHHAVNFVFTPTQ